MLGFALLCAAVALYALSAKRLEALNITGPIVFLLLGLAVNIESFSLVDLGPTSQAVQMTATVTLVLLLFGDASTVDLAALRRDKQVPLRLLLIGLPLTVILGALVARGLLPGVGVGIPLLVAAVLAPTDLSLGLAMFSNPLVPARVRREINVESGLNDGIAAPLVAVFTAVAIAEFDQSSAPLVEAVIEIAVGVGVGVATGVLGGWLLKLSQSRGTSSEGTRRFAAFALALVAYTASVSAHGNGFIAAFVGGLAFGAVAGHDAEQAAGFAEETGSLLSLFVWFMFGTSLIPAIAAAGNAWQPLVYALLSLTVIRMVPVALSLVGVRMHRPTTAFIGWFGPRGLASVVFLLQALATLKAAGVDTTMLGASAGWTILGSVVLHGASAAPVAAWYGRLAEKFAPGSPELEPTADVHIRQGLTKPEATRTT